MTTASTRPTSSALRPSTSALVRAELADSRYFWFVAFGVPLANVVLSSIIVLFLSEPVSWRDVAQSVPANWELTWFLLILISSILAGTNYTTPPALAGAGLRLQRAAGWIGDLARIGAAALIWLAYSMVMATTDDPLLAIVRPLVGSGPAAYALGAVYFALFLVGVAGIGRVIGHAFRVGSTIPGLSSIAVVVALIIGGAALAGRLSVVVPAGAWVAPFALGALIVALLALPLAWVLEGRGPIRMVA